MIEPSCVQQVADEIEKGKMGLLENKSVEKMTIETGGSETMVSSHVAQIN